MNFTQLTILLPCYSIETFDLDCNGDDAEQLLSGWSALWHPKLLANAQKLPRWLPAVSPSEDFSGHFIVLPNCCESMLPADWLLRAETADAFVLRHFQHREDVVAAALERLDQESPPLDPDLVGDFLALGFCRLQVELLTRKLHYANNLDETLFRKAVLAAADEAIQGNVEAVRGHLQAAFDRLHEAREYFYPTSARLLDLTLVAPSTLGAELRSELADRSSRNLLVSGEAIQQMAEREPATLDALKQALAENRAALIGGEFVEAPLPLLDPEAIAFHLRRGLAAYENHLGRRPRIFGRRRFGLTPVLPAILQREGFLGAFHCTLDDGRFPTGNQSRIQWEGLDGATIEAVGSLPLDAARSETFLKLTETLSHAMTLDNASTVLFAHWPGRSSPWYDDLRRIAAYSAVLGAFVTIDDFFEKTASVGQQARYSTDQYRTPYLAQDVLAGRSDPISRWVRYFHRRRMVETVTALNLLAEGSGKRNDECGMMNDELAIAVENSLLTNEPNSGELDEQLSRELQKPLVGFAKAIVGSAPSTHRGSLAVNPLSFSRQFLVPPLCPAMGFAWVGPGSESPMPVERKGWFGRRKPQSPPPMAEEHVLRNEFFEVRFDPHTGAIRTISDYHSRDPRLAQQIALRMPCGGEPGSDRNYSIMAADEWTIASTGPVLGEMIYRGRLLDHENRRVAGFQQTTRVWRGSRILEIEIVLDVERQPDANPWDSYYAVRFAWKDETAKVYRSVNMADEPTELTQLESPYFVDICHAKQHTTLLSGGLPYHRRFGPRKLDTLLAVQGETARTFRLGIGIDLPHPMVSALGFMTPPLILSDQPAPTTPSGWLFHLDCRNVLATHWEKLPSPSGTEAGGEGNVGESGQWPVAREGGGWKNEGRGERGEGRGESEEDSALRLPPSSNPQSLIPNPSTASPHPNPLPKGEGTSVSGTALPAGEGTGMAGFRVRLLETDGCGVRLKLRCYRAVRSARLIHPGDVPPSELTVEGDGIEIPIGPHQWIEVEACF